jgi:lipid-binding SYLF domain-containing protein
MIKTIFQRLFTIVALLSCLMSSPSAIAQWQADENDKKQLAAQAAILQIKERIPRSLPYFEDAYAIAVLPSVTRFGIGFGGAYGKGVVIEGENLIGTSGFWQFTGGIQAGIRYFSMIIFFKDNEALEYYKERKIQFLGQAGLAVATVGIAGTPAYNEGVAIITVTRLGLMAEFTYSGSKFTYKPLQQDSPRID